MKRVKIKVLKTISVPLYVVDCSPAMPVEIKMAFDTAAIGTDNSKYIMRFIAEVSDRLNLRESHSDVETVTTECAAKSLKDITFGTGHDRDNIEQSMAGTTQGFSSTMRNLRLSFKRDNNRKKIGVMFVGETLDAKDFNQAIRESKRASFMGIQLFVVGVGGRVNNSQTNFLATRDNQVFFATSYDSLDYIEGPLLLRICSLTWRF